ncbi:truncated hemoglobin YjbI [Staphylococcus schleiferi]|uniref:truncated hemoglobin YjbI n=1 Tax=Staphylococcus schleiferi TaxID=1295 RepID=UPI00248072B3|nr:truncated hemoglobin YjbI [Staphylococcus schleiferi]
MAQTPYEVIGQEKLYALINHFYRLVEQDNRINHLFPGDFAETARKQKQFLTQFLGGPDLYTQEHGHPMLRMRYMSFPIDHQAKAAWLENMHIAITEAQLPYGVGDYLYERLSLTANHMVNIEN